MYPHSYRADKQELNSWKFVQFVAGKKPHPNPSPKERDTLFKPAICGYLLNAVREQAMRKVLFISLLIFSKVEINDIPSFTVKVFLIRTIRGYFSFHFILYQKYPTVSFK